MGIRQPISIDNITVGNDLEQLNNQLHINFNEKPYVPVRFNRLNKLSKETQMNLGLIEPRSMIVHSVGVGESQFDTFSNFESASCKQPIGHINKLKQKSSIIEPPSPIKVNHLPNLPEIKNTQSPIEPLKPHKPLGSLGPIEPLGSLGPLGPTAKSIEPINPVEHCRSIKPIGVGILNLSNKRSAIEYAR